MSRRAEVAALACIAAIALVAVGVGACGDSTSEDPSQYAWAVGNHGTILATTDGGAHWSTQTSGTSLSLNGVSFADTSHGWAVGGFKQANTTTSLVLATTDGGAHWATQYDAAGDGLRTVACADAAHVWAVSADKALILASSDGGKTWATQYSDPSLGPIADLTFVDASHGWTIGGRGEVLATSDGGAHWAKLATLRGVPYGGPVVNWGITFADATHGWVVGDAISAKAAANPAANSWTIWPSVWMTVDGGATWRRVPFRDDQVGGMTTVACTDALHVWAGTDGMNHIILRSTDGGHEWVTAQKEIAPATVLALAFGDSLHGWAVSIDNEGSLISATTDGGITWNRQPVPSPLPNGATQLWDVACPPPTSSAER